MRPLLIPMVAALSWAMAIAGQRHAPDSHTTPADTPPISSLRWLVGARTPMLASAVWAQTITDYAGERLTASTVRDRAALCLQLDPSFTTAPRFGVLMIATLPDPDPALTEVLLRLGHRAAPDDPWFSRGLAVHLRRERPDSHPDEARSFLSLAAQSPRTPPSPAPAP